jgi:hypothetical protein
MEPDETRSPPPRSAPKDDWADWAISLGADEGAADAMTKAELIDRFGSPDAPRTEVTEPAVPDPAAPGAGRGEPAQITETAAQHAARDAGDDEADDEPPRPRAEPYGYVAAEDLFIGSPSESGVMPVRAYQAGALVPPHDVDRHGWRRQVRLPDDFTDISEEQ